jgi:pimeloyl-ACP methyl ester carboxylesterase
VKSSFNDISYTKVGRGPHLCFLHGFCENSSIWNTLIESLQCDYTCIAIDLPGFGDSSTLVIGTIPELSSQIHDLLEAENATNTVLFGHSMGGYILADYIGQYGTELRAAGFIHSTARADSIAKKENRQKTIDFIKKNGPQEFFRLFIPGLVAVQHLSRLRDKMTSMVTATKTHSILAGLEAMADRPDNTNVLASFDKPILWLKGDEDTHYLADEIFAQAAMNPISQVSLLAQVGHLSMLEEPQECLEKISTFLTLVNRRQPTS